VYFLEFLHDGEYIWMWVLSLPLQLTMPCHASMLFCFFHFTQCVWKKAQTTGLQILYRDNEEVRTLIRRAAVLPPIPLDRMEDVWFQALEDLEDAVVDTNWLFPGRSAYTTGVMVPSIMMCISKLQNYQLLVMTLDLMASGQRQQQGTYSSYSIVYRCNHCMQYSVHLFCSLWS
jgi:hypothetical protein